MGKVAGMMFAIWVIDWRAVAVVAQGRTIGG
jgi:hypothetical protein